MAGLLCCVIKKSFLMSAFVMLTLTRLTSYAENQPISIQLDEQMDSRGILRNVDAKLIIDAPPSYVWQTLTQYENFKDFIPGVQKSQVVSGNNEDTKVLDLGMFIHQYLPVFKYKVRVHENRSNYALTMSRISGDFKYLDADYRLKPRRGGNQTMLMYHLKIDPGVRVPGFGMNGFLKTNTEKTLRALQAQSLQEYRKSMIGQR